MWTAAGPAAGPTNPPARFPSAAARPLNRPRNEPLHARCRIVSRALEAPSREDPIARVITARMRRAVVDGIDRRTRRRLVIGPSRRGKIALADEKPFDSVQSLCSISSRKGVTPMAKKRKKAAKKTVKKGKKKK